LGSGFEVISVTLELEPFRVGQGATGLYTQQRRVTLGLVLVDVVGIVGDDSTQIELLRQPQQVFTQRLLQRYAVIHQLDEVVLRPENVPIRSGGLERLVELPEPKSSGNLPTGTSRGGHDPLGSLGDQLPVHARFLVLPLETGQ